MSELKFSARPSHLFTTDKTQILRANFYKADGAVIAWMDVSTRVNRDGSVTPYRVDAWGSEFLTLTIVNDRMDDVHAVVSLPGAPGSKPKELKLRFERG